MDSNKKDVENKTHHENQVVFLLDITGSMGSQIDGVKSMISNFCSKQELEFEENVNIHIWTFTESVGGCYISKSPIGASPTELINYTQKLTLSCPPDYPEIRNAYGGDGPENVTAGVASLLDSFSSKEPILCFIITDDAPHHAAYGKTKEAEAEKRWLLEHGHESDIFKVLNSVIHSLNVTFVPILYGSSIELKWYHQAAILTQGLILCPKSNHSHILADGLHALLESFQSVALSQQAIDPDQLHPVTNGFSIQILDFENFVPIESDFTSRQECRGISELSSDKDKILAALTSLMETACDRFTGKKSSKRCKGVNPGVIAASIRVLTMGMLNLIKSPKYKEDIFTESVAKLIQALQLSKSPTAENEIYILNKWVSTMDDEISPSSETHLNVQPVQCVVTLESAADTLLSLEQLPSTEDEVQAWMEIVQDLTMCRLISLSFPFDSNGKPDFADAWNASVHGVETSSVLTVRTAAKLRDSETCVYLDPISRREHNAAIILAHPNDVILTKIYNGLTALPSLYGLIQSNLISGGLRSFPSIGPGILSSALFFLIRDAAKSGILPTANWEVIRCITWSLKQYITTLVPKIVKSFNKGNGLNPSDSIPKLIAAVILFAHTNPNWEDTNIIQLLFEELTSNSLGFTFRKIRHAETVECGLEIFEKELELEETETLNCFISTNNLNDFDPLSSIHPLEEIKENLTINNIEDGIHKLSSLVANTTRFKGLVSILKIFYNVHKSDLKVPEYNQQFPDIPSLPDEELSRIYAESLILRQRSARYNLIDEKIGLWKRIDEREKFLEIIKESCVNVVQNHFKLNLMDWASKRSSFARDKLLNSITNIQGKTVEECNEALFKHKLKILGKTYKLGRFQVPEALQRISDERLKTLGVALCLGSWTTEPPADLRRSIIDISTIFSAHKEEAQLIEKEILKIPVCNRPPEQRNRHGHNCKNIYPGIIGWTLDYEKKRLSSFTHPHPKIVNTLSKMKEYTEFYYETQGRMLTVGKNRRALINWVFGYNQTLVNTKRVKDTIGLILENDDLDGNVQVQNLISKLNSSRNKGNKGLNKLEVFLKG